MNTVGNRIKKLRKEKKLTQKDLGKIAQVSDAAVVLWEKDVNKPKLESLQYLAPALETTIEYIMYGITDEVKNVEDFRPVARMLPVLSDVQAGNWTNVQSVSKSDIEQWLPAPPNAGKNSFYMIVRGISNFPHFRDGDFICIDPDISIEHVQTGEMIVAQCDGEATFKALVKDYQRMYLQALNPNFQPNILELKENCEYKGKYVGKFEPSKKFI
ncbi:LexA family protein [Acinetobacter sp. ANC 5045]|uniref:LexA family protein n=1 Tax=Acinetobacter sp. ANC 5045 TaxID=2529851 RepID=UPI00103F305C|nr:S24 family peptidase [Acinetobacter sp. ANC 5045]TCB18994.1 helix-turn-helix domain-containing protein [Acinetobacter sp. ANC 5045]